MKIISFNFNKISVEKFKNRAENLKMNTNVEIEDIKTIKQDFLKTKDDLFEVKFVYTLTHEPDLAKIELKGSIILSIEPKLGKEILKQWKDKKISDEFRIVLFNVILKKSNLRALQLEDEMNLPVHISLPLIRKEDIKKENNK